MPSVSRPYDVITFDCYGTLIDWERGTASAFVETAARDGITLEPATVVAAYDSLERVVQAEVYRRYRDVLGETAQRVAGTMGWRLTPERAAFLVDSLAHWPPFEDTNPALERLAAAGYQLGILSNTDDDLLALTCRHLTVRFELLVTAQQVRSYKPAHGHFREAGSRIGDRRWLHVSQSYFHDVEPALALGIPVAWVNRKGRPLRGAKPVREFHVLSELAAWLTDDTTEPRSREGRR